MTTTEQITMKLFETLKGSEYYNDQLEAVLISMTRYLRGYPEDEDIREEDRTLINESKKELKTLLYQAGHSCTTCGESRSGDCSHCQRLWSS